MFGKLLRNRKGQGLVEYALIIAGVTLIAAASIAIFGHKVTDMIAATAAILPGAHVDDNNPIVSGTIIEHAPNANGAIALDVGAIIAHNNTPRLGDNVLGVGAAGNGFGGLVVEANP